MEHHLESVCDTTLNSSSQFFGFCISEIFYKKFVNYMAFIIQGETSTKN